VALGDGVFRELLAGEMKLTPAKKFSGWEQGVRALYDQMSRIDIVPAWATVHDSKTRIPRAVEDLAKQRLTASRRSRAGLPDLPELRPLTGQPTYRTTATRS